MDTELPIRIAVLHVPPGVTFAIQRGKDELLPPSRSKDGSLIFDLSVRVSERKGGGSANVQIEGRARDGGPCCATVPLLDGWKISPT